MTSPAGEHDQGTIDADVCVVGAGVCGLWSACVLTRAGARVALVSQGPAGAGQTIASQGIIHGGVKYALGGQAGAASRAIAEMPGAWAEAMAGRGEVDLRGAQVLSAGQWLWTGGSIASRLTALAASKAIRTPVSRVSDRGGLPEGLQAAPGGVDIYHVPEPVLEPASVVLALVSACATAGVVIQRGEARLERAGAEVHVQGPGWGVRADRLVLCAGAGNERLLQQLARGGGLWAGAPVAMQRRGLHMVMVRGALPELYGHCVAGLSDKPRVTIGTQELTGGRRVWYVGGNLAETGVSRDRAAQIEATRAELAACVGWVPLDGCEFATCRWERAEGLMGDGARPDGPVVRTLDVVGQRVVVAWPTKLAFAPLVGRLVAEELGLGGPADEGPVNDGPAREGQALEIAPLPWQEGGVQWTR